MKVIMAGSSKTGTKSLKAALTKLGYNVYDNMEHVMYHCDDWIKIFDGKGSIEDFKRMYEGVDAVVDAPCYMFWYEIHQAFPDAKIILTTRDEESWFRSLKKQYQILDDFFSTAFCIYAFKFLPISRKSVSYMKGWIPELLGMPLQVGRLKIQHPINEMVAKKNFRERNAYVLQAAPKDKLLVYDVKDGWDPLCKFLDCDVPSEQFPHENIGGSLIVDSANNHEYTKKVEKQFLISVLVFVLLILFLCYSLSEYSYIIQIVTSVGGFIALLLIV